MKFTEVKDLTATELAKKQKAASADLFTLKMKNSLGQLANPIEIRDARRGIARIQTAISQKATAKVKGSK
jgi:large subunit ribosomal protein L29